MAQFDPVRAAYLRTPAAWDEYEFKLEPPSEYQINMTADQKRDGWRKVEQILADCRAKGLIK